MCYDQICCWLFGFFLFILFYFILFYLFFFFFACKVTFSQTDDSYVYTQAFKYYENSTFSVNQIRKSMSCSTLAQTEALFNNAKPKPEGALPFL